MTKQMLIDAAHPEEVRVCVLDNGRVEDFDFEFSARKPLRGNIYLARVTRVEPSLQAAFVEYGGNRHGFLAFNEIHPDYYQIPVSDRRQLQEAEAEEAALAAELGLDSREDDSDLDGDEGGAGEGAPLHEHDDAHDHADDDHGADDTAPAGRSEQDAAADAEDDDHPQDEAPAEVEEDADLEEAEVEKDGASAVEAPAEPQTAALEFDDPSQSVSAPLPADEEGEAAPEATPARRSRAKAKAPARSRGELLERYREARRKRQRLLRNYKIQEVIKRRQIMLIQVVKEERGNKGAALTTYLSLAGRYCVLMPNTARGGGISRKIGVAADRKRLRRVVDDLELSEGMGLIIRTAGAKRTKTEIKRDYDYLTRLWENIRTLTLQSVAPSLIYEEASLIKRAIRDLYDKDIDLVTVEGDDGYREAKDFMKMLMPSHAKNVRQHKEAAPLFLAHDVESQLDAMYQPTVRLKSGGYLVIHQTEALVAIDVNSGKATRERNIEQTALRTNLEAAKEAARQCRLRDLAGLIVIDFIDMEEQRNNRAVEKRFKDALKDDRARIQVGKISNFGLLEMSRQRRRSGIVDGTTHVCPTCAGAGAVRSHEMAALRILRAIENSALKERSATIAVRAAIDVALYVLNHKRAWLKRVEDAYAVSIEIVADGAKAGDNFDLERRGAPRDLPPPALVVRADQAEAIAIEAPVSEVDDEDDEDEQLSERPLGRNAERNGEREGERAEGDGSGRRRRRRRRRGRRGDEPRDEMSGAPERAAAQPAAFDADDDASSEDDGEDEARDDRRDIVADARADEGAGEGRRRRRRGRRGGRRNRGPGEAAGENGATGENVTGEYAAASADQPYIEGAWPHQPELLPAPAEQPAIAWSPTASTAEAAPEVVESQETAPAAPIEPAAPEAPTQSYAPEPPMEPETPRATNRKGWWQKAIGG